MLISPSAHARIFLEEAKWSARDYNTKLGTSALALMAEHLIVPALLPNPSVPVLRIHRSRRLREDWTYSLVALGSSTSQWRDWGTKTLGDLMATREPFAPLVRTGRRTQDPSSETVDVVQLEEVSVAFLRACNPGQSVALVPVRPPIEYLYNLAAYVEATIQDPVLAVSDECTTWRPRLLREHAIAEVATAIRDQSLPVVVQGPPGTGKSYLAAEIVSSYLREGKTACVTSLTHRALMEVAAKPALKNYAEAGRVRKLGLSTAELKELGTLEPADARTVASGQLLLITYHALSQWAEALPARPVYDLLVIEEASQAFLATLSLFVRLAERVLIIGDPQQLPPIFQHERQAFAHLPDKQAGKSALNGLATFAYNGDVHGARLTRTYRLGPRAASFTGTFYDDTLESAALGLALPPAAMGSSPDGLLKTTQPTDGPVLVRLPSEVDSPIAWVMGQIADLVRSAPSASVAVLLPRSSSVRDAQALKAAYSCLVEVRVETVDRMQGATVDYAFFVLGRLASGFGLDPSRFNVATSRARRSTWIVVQGQGSAAAWSGGAVGQYWQRLVAEGHGVD